MTTRPRVETVCRKHVMFALAVLCGCMATITAVPTQGQDTPEPKEATPLQPDPEPTATDDEANATAKIARWYDSKPAAISLRFDDSHPSHIMIAVPLLTEYGMVGTFLVNPGNDAYRKHRERWESEAIEGGHEFGNHTMHHRGARHDQEAEREIGECSKYIWNLFPHRSKLLAFRCGGGTTWKIKKPWSHYYKKWYLIHAPHSASVGTSFEHVKIWNMDMFKQRVEQSIEDHQWVSLYYHAIGVEKGMGISTRAFREQMRYLHSKRRDIWFGGIAQIYKYQEERRAAEIAIKEVQPFKLKIDITCHTDPKLYDQPLTVWVQLPRTWPTEDIQALNRHGKPMPMRRHTDTWNETMLSVPPVNGTYFIHVVDPLKGKQPPTLPGEPDRTVSDDTTGTEATLCTWFDGRRAALSIRFDDSHPTHILKAVPLLREYGFKGTFLINPGNPAYQKYRAQWEACARRGDQEFGNHTMHHRGAKNDDEVDYEVGECSRIIWSLFPDKSKVLAFSRGGGTTWTHTKPFRYWLDKYHLDRMFGSLSMADSYGDRISAFTQRLAQCIEKGAWMRTHYHHIGSSTGLGISDDNFRAVMDITKQHEKDLWIAGMADIFKYREERLASALSMRNTGHKQVTIELHCETNPELYDQPLTIQLMAPAAWKAHAVRVTSPNAPPIEPRRIQLNAKDVVRFDVQPITATFIVRAE